MDTYHLSEQEFFYDKNNWWLHSNKQGSNTMPLRHRSVFKQALSTLERLQQAAGEEPNVPTYSYKHKQRQMAQSSSSTWWNWQDSWWSSYNSDCQEEGEPSLEWTGWPVTYSIWQESSKMALTKKFILWQLDRLQLTAVCCNRRGCKDNTSKDPFSQCESLQGIRVQVKIQWMVTATNGIDEMKFRVKIPTMCVVTWNTWWTCERGWCQCMSLHAFKILRLRSLSFYCQLVSLSFDCLLWCMHAHCLGQVGSSLCLHSPLRPLHSFHLLSLHLSHFLALLAILHLLFLWCRWLHARALPLRSWAPWPKRTPPQVESPTTTSLRRLMLSTPRSPQASSVSLMTWTTMTQLSVRLSSTRTEDEPITLKKKVCRLVIRRQQVMIERRNPWFAATHVTSKVEKFRDKTLKANRFGLSWIDKATKSSLVVKRRSENTNSRLISTKK